MKEIAAVPRPGLTYWEQVNVARKRVPDGPCLIRRYGSFWRPNAPGICFDINGDWWHEPGSCPHCKQPDDE